MDQGDQLRLTTDRFRQDRIPPTYTFTFMGVTSSGCQLSIFLCKSTLSTLQIIYFFYFFRK
jgi:hypothetical protein